MYSFNSFSWDEILIVTHSNQKGMTAGDIQDLHFQRVDPRTTSGSSIPPDGRAGPKRGMYLRSKESVLHHRASLLRMARVSGMMLRSDSYRPLEDGRSEGGGRRSQGG